MSCSAVMQQCFLKIASGRSSREDLQNGSRLDGTGLNGHMPRVNVAELRQGRGLQNEYEYSIAFPYSPYVKL